MARYRSQPIGVFDSIAGISIAPESGQPWRDYQDWLAAGNVADPYVAPPPLAETLAQAKLRKAAAIRSEGMGRIHTRFAALKDFDDLKLIRELILSILPAALNLTANLAWVRDTYQAGAAALGQVAAAASIAEVDAVTPAWPAL